MGKKNAMGDQRVDEQFVQLALAINEHLPGYVDSYFGPGEWAQEARQAGKLSLSDLTQRVDELAANISSANEWDAQRKDFLERQINAMQMSLRLLAGENVSLAEEAQALYDIQPAWTDETYFLEYQKWLDETLPKGNSMKERLENWKSSLEIPFEKARDLLPFITSTLRELTHRKFNLPEDESFVVEFISNEPWMAYNRYLGEYKSRIEINTDIPMRIRQKGYHEHLLTLINSPCSVIAEGIATSGLQSLLTDQELEDWYREEILPRADMTHVDAKQIIEITRAEQKIRNLWGNAAFMLHDQRKSPGEVVSYLQKYEMSTEEDASRAIRFMSGPLDRSYIFTYTAGYDLLEELFSLADRDKYFARLLEEPVTPGQIREWIKNESVSP